MHISDPALVRTLREQDLSLGIFVLACIGNPLSFSNVKVGENGKFYVGEHIYTESPESFFQRPDLDDSRRASNLLDYIQGLLDTDDDQNLEMIKKLVILAINGVTSHDAEREHPFYSSATHIHCKQDQINITDTGVYLDDSAVPIGTFKVSEKVRIHPSQSYEEPFKTLWSPSTPLEQRIDALVIHIKRKSHYLNSGYEFAEIQDVLKFAFQAIRRQKTAAIYSHITDPEVGSSAASPHHPAMP